MQIFLSFFLYITQAICSNLKLKQKRSITIKNATKLSIVTVMTNIHHRRSSVLSNVNSVELGRASLPPVNSNAIQNKSARGTSLASISPRSTLDVPDIQSMPMESLSLDDDSAIHAALPPQPHTQTNQNAYEYEKQDENINQAHHAEGFQQETNLDQLNDSNVLIDNDDVDNQSDSSSHGESIKHTRATLGE